jgi:broad specificity phosphatase PhoE
MIIAFRHGKFPLNERSHLTGAAAFEAMEQPIPHDADTAMDLLREGREQGHRVHDALGDIAIYTCLRSDTLRTKTMAELALADQELPGGTHIVPELRERSRGIFSYAPNDWCIAQAGYPEKKSVLDWRPIGIDYNGNPGETIRQVRDTRVLPVLEFASHATYDAREAPVALSGHAEWKLALRARMLGFDDKRFREPLIPNPPDNHPALKTAKMVINGQSDMYDCTCSTRNVPDIPLDHADIFRTVVTEPGLEFDTGWLNVRDM